jgi:hypothetical protein
LWQVELQQALDPASPLTIPVSSEASGDIPVAVYYRAADGSLHKLNGGEDVLATFEAGAPRLDNSVLVSKTCCAVGEKCAFTVQLRDTYGNTCASSEALADVKFVTQSCVPYDDPQCSAVDRSAVAGEVSQKAGVISVTYTPAVNGYFKASLTVGGKAISGPKLPPSRVVLADVPAIPSISIATGEGLASVVVGAKNRFRVQANGLLRGVAVPVLSRDDIVAVHLTGAELGEVAVSSADAASSAYDVAFTAVARDHYETDWAVSLQVTLNGVDVRGSPFAVTMVPGAVAPTFGTVRQHDIIVPI